MDDLIIEVRCLLEAGDHFKKESKMHKANMCLDPLVLLTCIHSFNYSSTQRWKGPIGSFPLIPYSINALLSQSNLQTHAINYFKLEYLAKITHSYLKTHKKSPTQIKAHSTGSSEDQMK